MKKWKGMKKATFLQQLGRLLERGYPLASAIELLALNEKEEERTDLHRMIERLRHGEQVHEALQLARLPTETISFIYFGEMYGDLSTSLQEAGSLYLKKERFKQQMQKNLRYPLFLIWLLAMIAFLMVHYLFPHFKQMFHSLELELPFISKLFLFFIYLTPYLFGATLLLILSIVVFYFKKFRYLSPHRQMELLYRLPLLKKFLQTVTSYFFSLQLSGLLRGGMSIFQALSVFSKQMNIPLFQQEAQEVKMLLLQGEPFASVISKRTIFIDELSHVISHGEQSGSLHRELFAFSELLLKRLDDFMKHVLLIVQPILFLLIGFFVLIMFLATMLPVFKLLHSL